MSNIYIQEPPTNGKVLLKTSVGDIDIELWSKEAPKACRNFVQLCLEGYYNGTIFHRIVKDFIAQGGDPTGTGTGGESIYAGKPFRDEIHSRLRFVRRGLVAMANSGKDDNQSQFFFTLAATPELIGKHTIFGKVTGETVYNMIKLGEVHTDGEDRPIEPPKIKHAEVLSNPFDDIVPRQKDAEELEKEPEKKSQTKAKKNYKLLSFGEEAEEEEEIINKESKKTKSKGKSAHDLTNDPRLSSVSTEIEERRKRERSDGEDELEGVKKKFQSYERENQAEEPADNKEAKTSSRMEELIRERKELQKTLRSKDKSEKQKAQVTEEAEPTNEALAEYKKERSKYKELKKSLPKKGASREQQTLAILAKFKQKLDTVATLARSYGDEDDNANEDGDEEATEDTDLGCRDGRICAQAASRRRVDQYWEGPITKICCQHGAYFTVVAKLILYDEDTANDVLPRNRVGMMGHKLECGDNPHKVLDANITDVDRYELYDPRNPIVQRRREESKKVMEQKSKSGYSKD